MYSTYTLSLYTHVSYTYTLALPIYILTVCIYTAVLLLHIYTSYLLNHPINRYPHRPTLGTTRDIVDALITRRNNTYRIIDTAGKRGQNYDLL